jgi:hypothetical protein
MIKKELEIMDYEKLKWEQLLKELENDKTR